MREFPPWPAARLYSRHRAYPTIPEFANCRCDYNLAVVWNTPFIVKAARRMGLRTVSPAPCQKKREVRFEGSPPERIPCHWQGVSSTPPSACDRLISWLLCAATLGHDAMPRLRPVPGSVDAGRTAPSTAWWRDH